MTDSGTALGITVGGYLGDSMHAMHAMLLTYVRGIGTGYTADIRGIYHGIHGGGCMDVGVCPWYSPWAYIV